MSLKEDYERRIKDAFINESGMIVLGPNKIHPDSPFGESLIEKYPHIKTALDNYCKQKPDQETI